MNRNDPEWKEHLRRTNNNLHGVFITLVGVAIRNDRISLDEFADRIGMTHRRIRLLLTGAIDLTLNDLSDAAFGIQHEIVFNPIRIMLDPIMTAEDLGLTEDEDKE